MLGPGWASISVARKSCPGTIYKIARNYL